MVISIKRSEYVKPDRQAVYLLLAAAQKRGRWFW